MRRLATAIQALEGHEVRPFVHCRHCRPESYRKPLLTGSTQRLGAPQVNPQALHLFRFEAQKPAVSSQRFGIKRV